MMSSSDMRSVSDAGSFCVPQPMAVTCAGKCGTVANTCMQPVNCPGCTLPQTCGGGGTPNVCAVPVGTVPWSELFSGMQAAQNPYPQGIAVDLTGSALVVGGFYHDVNFGCGDLASAGSADMFLAKLDGTGHCTFGKRYGDAEFQEALAVTTDATGNIYLTGRFRGTVDFGCGPITASQGFAVPVAKLSPAGACLWSKSFNAQSAAGGVAIALDAAGNIYVDGYYATAIDFGSRQLTATGFNDGFLMKLDPAGNGLWAKDWGPPAANMNAIVNASAVAVDASGNAIATGTYYKTTLSLGGATFPSQNKQNIFLVKLDPTGAHLSSKGFSTPSYSTSSAILLDASGDVLITGQFQGTVNFGTGAITSGGDIDGFVAAFGPTLTNLWTRHLLGGAGSGSTGLGLALLGTDVLLGGQFGGAVDFGGGALAASNEVFLARYDRAGNYISARGWGTAVGQNGYVATDPSGNAFLFGAAKGSIDFGQGNLTVTGDATSLNLFLAKLKP